MRTGIAKTHLKAIDHVKKAVATVPGNDKILEVSAWELKAHVVRARVVTPADQEIQNIADRIKVDDKYKLKAEATRFWEDYKYKKKNALKDPACKPLKEEIKKAIKYLDDSLAYIQLPKADVSYIKNTLLKQYTEQYNDPLFKRINQHKQRSASINKNKRQK